MSPLDIKRTDALFVPDPERVITKPYLPGDELFPDGHSRIQHVVKRILAMSDDAVAATLGLVDELFADRHRDLAAAFDEGYRTVADRIPDSDALSAERKMLVGSYFTHEYSVESAALTNPSMVPHPDQSGLGSGDTRFVMSLRAIGEGHISSIEFRSGVIDSSSNVIIDAPTNHLSKPTRRSPIYDKRAFATKLTEIGAMNALADGALARLSDQFTMDQLEAGLADVDLPDDRWSTDLSAQTIRTIHWLASSNYETTFDERSVVSDRVIYPVGPTESHGMEDARFVRFTHDDETVRYYATYTAFDGFKILPQLIETADFVSFRISTLNGARAENKGMALFPRMIGGRYAALSRNDNENNYLMFSDHIRDWNETEKIQVPDRPWELMQIGNCGSPLETEAGWLVITHGVGPMRQYSLGAILLDLSDPGHVIGHLKSPLLSPNAAERNGYVPNVVYSCGSMIHGNQLVLPYGFSDIATRIALVPLDDLLSELVET
ncbi:MAG TPA: glycoside hydrolase family 130 protein [Acidimicrobiia bacterium]